MIKRASFSFIISSFFGLVAYLLIEFFVGVIIGVEGFTGLTPEYLAKFPSETLALGVAVLSHGLIGAVFAAATVIYEKVQIGFILQNVIYVLLTGVIWIPIICFVWQLYRYPAALISTIGGFVLTYVIMSVVGYSITKKEVEQINARLAEEA
jgi:hypothetical protein